ncbi:MAG: phytanoyl-CoA dioxygenase family protein [Chitinophagales bacterium]|nr:phytanoyl-CoA dioxygenase family protein [Chitinophagales bacterium]
MVDYNFSDHGFVILKNVFPENVLASIRELTSEIISYGELKLEDPYRKFYLSHRTDQGALHDLYQKHPEFQSLVKNDAILNKLTEVLGEDICMYENCLVYKPKGKRNAVPWHQDFISRPNEPRKYISWTALDDVRIENGAMKVIPGSHKFGFLKWFRVKGETHHDRIDLSQIDESKAIYAELDAGDVMIFNQLLVHSSDECNSTKPRRAFRTSYIGMDEIVVPRGSPLVLRGGRPNSLGKNFPQKATEVEDSLAVKFLRKVAYRLNQV